MDGTKYRERYARELQRAATERIARLAGSGNGGNIEESIDFVPSSMPRLPQDIVAEAIALVGNKAEDAELRASALHSIANEVSNSLELMEMTISLLRDEREPVVLRLEALQVMQLSSFRFAVFSLKRPEYMAALRELVNTEDRTLREQILEILAQQKDEYVQRRLLEGLEDRARELIVPERAIQLLGYDVHAEHYSLLRKLVQDPPSAAAKREAVRLLAADPDSAELLTNILKNKHESRQVRLASAMALQALAPAEYEEQARQIVLDTADTDELRAAAITSLTSPVGQVIEESLVPAQDPELIREIERLEQESGSRSLQRAAARYLSKQSN